MGTAQVPLFDIVSLKVLALVSYSFRLLFIGIVEQDATMVQQLDNRNIFHTLNELFG
jgi:hypothetical protein